MCGCASLCPSVLARHFCSQVLLALARKLSEGDDAEGGSGVVPLADGDGGAEGGREGTGADELLFFVSTDADATMFGRWARYAWSSGALMHQSPAKDGGQRCAAIQNCCMCWCVHNLLQGLGGQ